MTSVLGIALLLSFVGAIQTDEVIREPPPLPPPPKKINKKPQMAGPAVSLYRMESTHFFLLIRFALKALTAVLSYVLIDKIIRINLWLYKQFTVDWAWRLKIENRKWCWKNLLKKLNRGVARLWCNKLNPEPKYFFSSGFCIQKFRVLKSALSL